MKVLARYVEEKGLKPDLAISIKENTNFLSKEDAQELVDYMSSCTVIDEWLSPTQDPIDSSKWIPTRTWSDGVYFWKESHIHFIREYRVRVPVDFLKHARGQSRSKDDASLETLDKADLYSEYEKLIDAQIEGDTSIYDLSY